MSPTNFTPGRSAVKSRCSRSGVAARTPSTTVVTLYGRGWHDTSPRSRMIERTSSSPAATLATTSSLWIRRYP